MLKKIADNRDEQSLAVKFRKRRFAFFNSLLFRLERPVSVLDVGGAEAYWKTMGMDADDRVSVTLLNLTKETVILPNLSSVAGDARQLNFEDNSFDVVFSNSVIEHVGGYADQMKMAKEVMRVGNRYFIQTPNKYFPLEPHFLFPFFQFLPVAVRVRLLQSFNLGWFPKTPERTKAIEIVESIRLLGRDEFLRLFPGARLYEEKVFGLTKSFVAYSGWDSA
jgi:ubiquinone/menaquinone biosynthesis C-methylase UbiE